MKNIAYAYFNYTSNVERKGYVHTIFFSIQKTRKNYKPIQTFKKDIEKFGSRLKVESSLFQCQLQFIAFL